MDDAVSDFLNHLRCERGLSPHTIEAYGRDVGKFVLSLSCQNWEDITSEGVLKFLSHLKEAGYASSSICRSLIAVKVFFRFLKKEGKTGVDLGRYFDTPKIWQLIPEVMTIAEVDQLLAQPQADDFIGARDKAMLELLYATGMRVSELCRLKLCDLQDTFVKLKGKGNKERIVPVGKRAIDAVDAFLVRFPQTTS